MSAPLTWQEIEQWEEWGVPPSRLVAALEVGEAMAAALERPSIWWGDDAEHAKAALAAWRQCVAAKP